MERNRLIAIVCAIIATALVIIAGKSCADDAIKNGRKNHQENERQARPGVSYSFSEGSTSAEPTETDVFGKPVTTQAQTEEVSYDIFGKPITTAPTSEVPQPGVVITYDENGDIVSSIVPETQPYNSTVTAVSEPTEAVPVETDPAQTTIPPYLNGFDHNRYDPEGNTVPTMPSDFTIIIN